MYSLVEINDKKKKRKKGGGHANTARIYRLNIENWLSVELGQKTGLRKCGLNDDVV